MPTGKIKWYNTKRKFGFITPDDSSNVLFVQTNAAEGVSFRENDPVKYIVEQRKKYLYARSVTLITK